MSSFRNNSLNKHENYYDLKSIELCKKMQKKCSLNVSNKLDLNFQLNKNSSVLNEKNSRECDDKSIKSSNIPQKLSDFYSKCKIYKPQEIFEFNKTIDIKTNQNLDKIGCFPLTSTEILRYYNFKLTDYEKEEIRKYSNIWYIGNNASKINASKVLENNYGYDDSSGSYIKVIHDHIAYRYETLEVIGKGSFGQVIRALDHKEKKEVALKILKNKPRFHLQEPNEIRILSHILKKDPYDKYNVIHMYNNFYFRNHLCITFELLSINIYQLIKNNNYQGLNIYLIKKFSLSILNCLKLLYNEKIIHCDLKPENILLKYKGSNTVKVIDFGYSCFNNEKLYTYIQSRFYRAPEVILGIPYSSAIDMWSFACILFELYTGSPLFPGENEADQLLYIIEFLDLPPKDLIQESTRKQYFFDNRGNPLFLMNKLNKIKRKKIETRNLAHALNCTDNLFIDFIYKCLTWKQEERMTPDQALKHEWLNSLNDTRNKSNTILLNNENPSIQSQHIQHFIVKELSTDELLSRT